MAILYQMFEKSNDILECMSTNDWKCAMLSDFVQVSCEKMDQHFFFATKYKYTFLISER